jgi:hypothetical protein
MTIKTPMFQLVELIIPATVNGFNQFTYFQQQPQLQSTSGNQTVYVKGIDVLSNQALTTSPLTAGSPVAGPGDIANGVLVINIAGTLKFQNIPLALMNRVVQSPGIACPSVYDLFQLRNIWEIDWTKSYVTTVAPPAAPPFSYLFGVHYSYEPDQFDY